MALLFKIEAKQLKKVGNFVAT